jgi:hypothetical protein
VAEAKYRLGNRPIFTLQLENRSNREVSIGYFAPTFWYPSFVSQSSHEKSQVTGVVYDGPAQPVHVSLKPHETVSLPDASFRIVAEAQHDNQAYWMARPGHYLATFHITLPGGSKADWAGELTSNSVPLEVLP